MKYYCTSPKCTNNHPAAKRAEKILTRKHTGFCEDCGWALIEKGKNHSLRHFSSKPGVREQERGVRCP